MAETLHSKNLSVPQMVEEFAKVTGQPKNPEMSAALIQEEFYEWRSEFMKNTKAPQLKELFDLVYVIYGYARSRGWDLQEAIARGHVNNMDRIIQDDGTIKRREDGKIMKNPNAPKIYLEDLV